MVPRVLIPLVDISVNAPVVSKDNIAIKVNRNSTHLHWLNYVNHTWYLKTEVFLPLKEPLGNFTTKPKTVDNSILQKEGRS